MLEWQQNNSPDITYADLIAKKKACEKANKEKRKNLDTKWHGDMNINAEAKKIWKLLEPWHKGKPLPPVHILPFEGVDGFARGRYGWAHVSQPWLGIKLKKIPDQTNFWLALVHELAHMAVGSRPITGQWNKKRAFHDREFYMAMREVTQRRWKCKISFAKVGKWGYDVDALMREQLQEQDAIKFKPRKVSVVDDKIELVLEGSNA
jgi:hypothetical protein